MQTFLPYPDFKQSAKVLDYRRLGKQRVEAFQLLKALRGESKGWTNHPAALMWKGYENALTEFMNVCIEEWIRRGYRNTMQIIPVLDYELPAWFGQAAFHLAHQSNLLRKDPTFYGALFPDVKPDMPYIWPVKLK